MGDYYDISVPGMFPKSKNMKRRHFITSVSLVVAGTILTTDSILSSCTSAPDDNRFSDEDIHLLNEIGEVILPATDSSPGAKEAKVGEFMKVYVEDCYPTENQKTFLDGIASFRKTCWKSYRKNFTDLDLEKKKKLIKDLDAEALEHAKARQERKKAKVEADAIQAGKTTAGKKTSVPDTDHWFAMVRSLTLMGYFTSESGATMALRYMQTPGYFAGDIPYQEGDRAWAT